jgi:hypothetical protein
MAVSVSNSPLLCSRSFALIKDSMLQSTELPFAEVLDCNHWQEIFDAHQIDFGNDEDAIYTPAITLWALISQVFFKGEMRSCKAAVGRVASLWATLGNVVCGTNTGAYCRARAKISWKAVRNICCQIAQATEAKYDADELDAELKRHDVVVQPSSICSGSYRMIDARAAGANGILRSCSRPVPNVVSQWGSRFRGFWTTIVVRTARKQRSAPPSLLVPTVATRSTQTSFAGDRSADRSVLKTTAPSHYFAAHRRYRLFLFWKDFCKVARSRYRKRLSVYPNHQPRRGGIVIAGAARPRSSMKRNSLLSPPMAPPPTFRCRPSGPEESYCAPWFEQNREPSWLNTGGTSVTRCGSRKRLSVYPKHQPRRGGIMPAGAARPRGSMKRNALLFPPAFRCRPSGPEETDCDPGFKQNREPSWLRTVTSPVPR